MTVPISFEYGVPHVMLCYEAESVSCRLSDLLQSLEPLLLCLDSSVGSRLSLSISSEVA